MNMVLIAINRIRSNNNALIKILREQNRKEFRRSGHVFYSKSTFNPSPPPTQPIIILDFSL